MIDIIIGEGNKLNSATTILSCSKFSAYENKNCYWVYISVLDLNIIIFKDTKQGERLKGMIENDASRKKIYNYLFKLAVKRINPKYLKVQIGNIKKQSFRKGMSKKESQIKKGFKY